MKFKQPIAPNTQAIIFAGEWMPNQYNAENIAIGVKITGTAKLILKQMLNALFASSIPAEPSL